MKQTMSRETKYIPVHVYFKAKDPKTEMTVRETFCLMVPEEVYNMAAKFGEVLKEQTAIMARIYGLDEETAKIAGWFRVREAYHA